MKEMPKQIKKSTSLSSPTGGQGAFLFVYGTLRKDYNLNLVEHLANDLKYIGKAKVNASLYDLGSYPAAIKEQGNGEVIGDIYFVHNPAKVFCLLDEYEGEEYSREKEEIQLRSGKTMTAWIYWYNKKPEAKQKIKQKDYLIYLKNKNAARQYKSCQ